MLKIDSTKQSLGTRLGDRWQVSSLMVHALSCQPGERDSFNIIRIETQLICAQNLAISKRLLQPFDQVMIVYPTTTDKAFDRDRG